MTSIDSTAIPECLAEECIDAVIQDGETHVSKLGEPKLVFITPRYANSTVIPSATISGRTITFQLSDNLGGAYATGLGCYVLVKGRL